MRGGLSAIVLLVFVAGVAQTAPAPVDEPAQIDLSDLELVCEWGLARCGADSWRRQEHSGWRELGAFVTAPLGLWSYWYREPVLRVETVPDGATVRISVLHGGHLRGQESFPAPLALRLPSRAHRSGADSLKLKVTAPGCRARHVSIRVDDVPELLLLELEPLPNSLVFAGLSHVAGHSSLLLRTTEEPRFRLTRGTSRELTVALPATTANLDHVPRLEGGLVEHVHFVQAGPDLLVQISIASGVEVRSQGRTDRVRRQHLLQLGLTRTDSRAPTPLEARSEFEQLDFDPAEPCGLRVEQVLRAALEIQPRATRRTWDAVADLYRREAMRALGRAERGTVRSRIGPRLRVTSPVELELALQEAGDVEGYDALLWLWSRRQPSAETALRSLVAPELEPETFGPFYRAAEADWLGCRNGS